MITQYTKTVLGETSERDSVLMCQHTKTVLLRSMRLIVCLTARTQYTKTVLVDASEHDSVSHLASMLCILRQCS